MRKPFANIIPVLTILFAIFATFKNVTNTFFQQDEWQYFGSTIYALQSSHPIANILLPLQGQLTHFFPLATLMFLLEYIFFKTNFPPYVLLSLLIHTANALLLYILVYLLTRKRVLAWGAALLFSVNSLAHQPITWVAAGIGTLPGTFFLLLFFLSLVRFGQTKRRIMLIYCLLSLLTSILFKETSLFVFLFLPLVWFTMKIVLRRFLEVPKVALFTFVGLGVFYIVLRIFFLIIPLRSEQPEIGDVSLTSPAAYVYRLVTVPLKAFPQSIIPFSILKIVSGGLVHLAYPYYVASDGVANPYVAESIVFDLTCYLASTLLLFVSFVCYRRMRKQEPALTPLLVISLLFIGTSAIPFIFVPGLAGFFSIFEPRNLYVVGIGSTLWFVLVLYSLVNWSRFAKKYYITILLVALIALFHSFSIQHDIRKLIEIGTIRKHLLTTVETAYPALPAKVVFFTQSDTSYYGLPDYEKVLPIQSGFGRMLMVWYQDNEKFPGCLYENQFLHDLRTQGYKYCDGRGFGYARTYESLLQILHENKLNGSDVIAFAWTDKEKQFTDIAPDIRSKLRENLR